MIMANTIQDKLAYLEETKGLIKEAIIAKGVSVSEVDTFRSYADKIGSIETGGGTSDCSVSACFDEVGYTFVPIYIQKGIETAVQFKAAWNPSNTSIDITGYKDSMVFFPKVDTSNVTTLNRAFQNTSILVFPNNDFPALTSESAFDSIFAYASRLVSIDFGNMGAKSFSLARTFEGCENLQRLHIDDNSETRFSIAPYAFYECTSLSKDEEQCNIFNFINYDNANLSHTFYGAIIVRDFNFINPKSLEYSFNDSILSDHNITFTYNNYENNKYIESYFYNAFSNNSGYSGNILKLTGNLTLNTYCYSIVGNANSYTKSIFKKLDISNFNYTNTSNNTTTSYHKSFIDYLKVDEVIGLETFHESYPNLTANKYHNYFITKLLSYNTLKSFPEGVETYWNKHKDNFDWKFGQADTGILSSLYKIHGTIDISFLNVQLVAEPNNIISSIGENPDLVIRLDSMNWSGVTNANNNTLFNSPNVVALYTPFNFDSTTVVNMYGLTNWTDHDSLIWSLLTHSTDRVAQSLGTQKIKLSANSKNALTEDERRQIEAKGYKLV